MNTTRLPICAGRFYPSDSQKLHQMVQGMLQPQQPKRNALGVLVPHAGYLYSGHIAGETLSHIQLTPTVLILCPKHTRLGAHTSLLTTGRWIVPNGHMDIDTALAQHLLATLPHVVDDPLAHAQEHAIEVILPFLCELQTGIRFVPLAMGYRDLSSCSAMGRSLGKALQNWEEPVLVISSSDMNHFEGEETTNCKDQYAIDAMLHLDPKGLYEVCDIHQISMCGVVPTVVAMFAMQQLGLQHAELLNHATSGRITGDWSRVVGYAGITFNASF